MGVKIKDFSVKPMTISRIEGKLGYSIHPLTLSFFCFLFFIGVYSFYFCSSPFVRFVFYFTSFFISSCSCFSPCSFMSSSPISYIHVPKATFLHRLSYTITIIRCIEGWVCSIGEGWAPVALYWTGRYPNRTSQIIRGDCTTNAIYKLDLSNDFAWGSLELEISRFLLLLKERYDIRYKDHSLSIRLFVCGIIVVGLCSMKDYGGKHYAMCKEQNCVVIRSVSIRIQADYNVNSVSTGIKR